MKRLFIALAGVGLSASAFAAMPAANDPSLVSVPQLSGGVVAGLTGVYVQPTNANGALDYAVVNSVTSSSNNSTNFSSKVKNINPGYDFGWGANLGYVIPGTGNDVGVNYFHLATKDTASTNVAPNLVTASITSPFADGFSAAKAKMQYDLNQVDVTVGQFINVGCRARAHLFTGLRWADLDGKANSSYNNAMLLSGYSENVAQKSDFEGVGPMAGIDASYYIGMGFGAVAHADTALLVGSINAKTTDTDYVGAQTTTTTYSTNNTHRIVPVVDAKLGGDYTYMINNASNSSLSLEAGWQVSNYFNAVDSVASTHTTSDLGLSGPYVSLTFHA